MLCPGRHDRVFNQNTCDETTNRSLQNELLRVLYVKSEKKLEEERKYISRELHDELGQLLSVIRLNVTTIDFRFGDANTDLRNMTLKTINTLDNAIKTIRTIATRLRPVIWGGGLIPTLKRFTQQYVENTGIACEFHAYCSDIPLDEYRAMTAFRIILFCAIPGRIASKLRCAMKQVFVKWMCGITALASIWPRSTHTLPSV